MSNCKNMMLKNGQEVMTATTTKNFLDTARNISRNEETVEFVGELFDFFVLVFNHILYKTSSYPKESYFFIEIEDAEVAICGDAKVAEYIEMCSKKIVSMLLANSLEGVQLNLLDRSIVLQRFVFAIEGSLPVDGFNKISILRLVQDLRTQCQHTVEKLNLLEKEPVTSQVFKHKCPRFQISLGLTNSAADMYNGLPHGPFSGDPDIDIFPWSKPRTTTAAVATPKSFGSSGYVTTEYQLSPGTSRLTDSSTPQPITTTPSRRSSSASLRNRMALVYSSSMRSPGITLKSPGASNGTEESRISSSASTNVWPINTIKIGKTFQMKLFLSYAKKGVKAKSPLAS